MTSHDPIAAILDQLAAHHEQLTRLTCTLDEHAAVLAELTTPDRADPDACHPEPAPQWWNLPAAASRTHRPAARLGRAGLPARLRPPGRHPRPVLGDA